MNTDAKYRSYLLVLASVFVLAVAARTVSLYWSPLPATLDGIEHAAHARTALASGHLPIADLRADHLLFVGLLATAGSVLAVPPITLAQPFSALVGAASCLVGVALVRRIAREAGWSPARARFAAAFVGISLAVSGIYLRRTGVPDEELLAHVFLPLVLLSVHRTLLDVRLRWAAITTLFVFVFPITHTLSTVVALLAVLGLTSLHLARDPTGKTLIAGVGIGGGFSLYAAGYYAFAGETALTVPYVDRIGAYPGLFVAWLVVLIVGVVWFQRLSRSSKRALFFAPILVGFSIVAINEVRPVFPGTVATPPLVGALLLSLLVPTCFAGYGLFVTEMRDSTANVLLALIGATAVLCFFSLTATLTPEYFGTVMRVQTFAHLPVLALAALAGAAIAVPQSALAVRGDRSVPRSVATDGGTRDPRLGAKTRAFLVCVLLASVVASAPLGYVNLDTASFPSGTMESEFDAAGFVSNHLTEHWSGDHTLTLVASHYFYGGGPANGTMYDAREWLRGGPSPCRPTLSQNSWTTTGAHFFPAAPETVPPTKYDAWISRRNSVYTASGIDPLVLTLPRSGAAQC